MGLRQIGAVILILLSLMVAFKDYFVVIFIVFLSLFILYYIIRFLADIFWWGKDNGKW